MGDAAGARHTRIAYQLPELKYLPPAQIAQWTKSLENRLKNPQYNADNAKTHIDNRMRILRALHQGGVRILAGSDAPQQFNVPGFSMHSEMRRMTDAGMSVRGPEVSDGGRRSDFKSRAVRDTVDGRADLILADANPLQALANLEKRSGVMINGRWLPQSEIDKRLAEIAAAR